VKLYLFWSESDKAVFGFTAEPMGGNLPPEFAPWTKNAGGEAVYTDQDEHPVVNAVVLAVQRDGFYLGRSSPPGVRSADPTIH
jgi:hypothetical protein